jgi:hypothetical protein
MIGRPNPPWYVPPALGPRILVACALLAALAGSLVSCGGDDSSGDTEASGNFPVKVVTAEFPTEQRLGETVLLRLGVRNTGERAVPALTMTISVGGRAGRTSSLPFTIHDPQPDLAQPDRPVWVLAATYPRLAGSSEPGGAQSANQKTFNFGRLEPDETVEAIWKLSAVKEGRFPLVYSVDASLGGEAKAVTAGDTRPGGSFAVEISSVPQEVEVTDSGEVVEIKGEGKGS